MSPTPQQRASAIQSATSKANRGECDGSCETRCDGHRGECRVVTVYCDGKSWGTFSYCEQAVDDDRGNGFVVKQESLGEET
jgi:hypothetical protein